MALLRSGIRGFGRGAFVGGWPILAMGIFVALALTTLIGAELWRERTAIEAQAFRETRNLAALLGQNVAQSMKVASEIQQAFADRGRIALQRKNFDSPQFATELTLLPQGLPQIAGMILLDASGRAVISTLTGTAQGADLSGQAYFQRVVAAGREATAMVTGTLFRDGETGRWLMPISSSFYDDNGALLGVAAVMVDPQVLVGPFDVLNIGEFSAATLMQNDGIIVARLPDEGRFVGRTIAGGELDRRVASQAEGSMRVTGVLYGRDLFMSYRQVPGTPYIVNVAFDANQILMPWLGLATLYAGLNIALMAAIVLLVWLVRQNERRRVKIAAAQQVQDIIEGMSTQVALLKGDGTIIEVNRALLDSAGLPRDAVVGRKLWETFWHAHSPASQEQVRSALNRAVAGEIVRGDFHVRAGKASFAVADMTFQSTRDSSSGKQRVIASAIDVTDRRRLERHLAQSQKLEAIGLLAGGIAHDFNNILGAIANFAGLLIDDLKDRASEQSYAARITRACDYGKQVVTQLLTYARPSAPERTAIDMRDVLKEMEMLVRPSLPASSTLLVDSGKKPAPVLANRAQLTQIFVNLCLNARDALANEKGSVQVGLSIEHPADAHHPAGHAEEPPVLDRATHRSGQADLSRSYVRVTVADDGAGMDGDTLKRVFEPFFTTKSRRDGTGLGLAIVDTIVLSLNGCYKVESRIGQGTEFAIYLPFENVAEPPEVSAPAESPSSLKNIRVLIVDDDLDSAEAAAMCLTRAGCEVSVTDDPVEALGAVTEDPGAWDVVVTDERMPRMNGTELMAKLRSRLPDFPVVLCSGSAAISEASAKAKGADEFVPKPIDPARLTAAVAAAARSKAATSG